MTTSPWNRVQELFEQASERPREEREAYVIAACADDPELRTEVLSLLEHDGLAPVEFMRPPKPPPESKGLDSASADEDTEDEASSGVPF